MSTREALTKTTAVILVVVIAVGVAAGLLLTGVLPGPAQPTPTPTPTPGPTPPVITIGNITIRVTPEFREFVEKAKGGEISVKIYLGIAHSPEERPAFREVIEMFENEYPGIDVEVLEYAAMGTLEAAIRSAGVLPKEQREALVGSVPDVFSWAHDWIGKFAEPGYIIALEDYIGEDAISDIAQHILPVAMSSVIYKLKTYGLPYAGEALALYVNTKLVPQPPRTFDELKAIMEQFYKPEEGKYGIAGQTDSAYHLQAWVTAFGGFFYDEITKQLGVNSTGTKEGIKFFIRNVLRYMDVSDLGHFYQRELFVEGRAPIYISGPWDLAYIKEHLGLDGFTVVPYPKIDDKIPKPWSGFRTLYISVMAEAGGTARTYAAILFVLYFTLNDNALLVLVRENGYAPVKLSVVEYIRTHPEEHPIYKIVLGFYEQVLDTVPMPRDPVMDKVWGVNTYIVAILNEYTQAIAEGLSVDEAVERAVAVVDELLDQAYADIQSRIGG